ncbi:helix-turn-helix domain-containing protein [Leptospira vanthielii]|uniref:DNA-binding helix-turn-helix protein n=1 Tax=Leptospira vanthielii serovar Holland str. Waz Holland = ATCC 700522 TaxID=1218591 RepID=N1W9B3_9LEPT|nr:helix-turn-helix domain-containing protein [Leptospira vanthielii]EMY71578.1 DNA-binding helix-turn-helix protein [Leptospira vanthielii serovar Holland str. Waz Holland = ATCC 700522]
MNESKRTGVWVAQWMEDLGLTPNQTKLYAEIVSLHTKGGCFASNEYLAAVLRLKRDTVSRLVSQLKKKGLLKQTGFDGRKRYLKPVVPAVESGSDSSPKKDFSSGVPVTRRIGITSKSESCANPKPSLKYELHTNIQKNILEKDKDADWKEFLAWSERRLSFSTSFALSQIRGPEVLTGSQLSYWERFKANPR